MFGLKRISADLANFFKNIGADIDAFQFLFTKYLDRPDPATPIDKEDILATKTTLKTDLLNAYEALNDDDKADKNLKIFYDKLTDIAKKPDDIILIDPFDKEGRLDILETLGEANKISHPTNSFGMRISEKSRSAVTD